MSYRSVFRPGLFSGQVVMVTGGGSGIGRCTAHELVALGAKVALVGRRIEKLESVAAEIAEVGGEAACFPCDIREEEKVKATVTATLARFGRIDGLVNNAGGQFAAPAEAITQKGWETVVRNNLTGGYLMARECFTQWMAENGGSIVNIVADMWNGMPGMAHSGAARAGMVNLTETLALEWAVCNVRVNALAPGWVASSGMDHYPPEMADHIRNLKNVSPLGRMGTESEMSAGIVFLLSEAAGFISGTTLRVDGAVPNIRPSFPMKARQRPRKAPVYDGFHLATTPKVLQDD